MKQAALRVLRNGPRPWAVFLFICTLLTLHLALRGIGLGSDTRIYVLWADRLIASSFDYPQMVREQQSGLAVTYAFFVTLVALLRLLFGNGWWTVFLALNIASVALVGTLLVRLTTRVSGHAAGGWAALALFLACQDVWQWSRFILSDSTFLLLAYAVFLMEARRLLGAARRWSPVFAASAGVSLFRPTGFLLFPITAWSYLLQLTRGCPRVRRLQVAGLCLCGVGAMLVADWIVQDTHRWPFDAASQAVGAVAETYAKGQIVWDRLETYRAAPTQLADYWLISADRFVHFFAPFASGFSWAHVLLQLAFYVPTYALASLWVILLLRGASGAAKPERDVSLAAVGAILFYAFFHAIMQVDFDWRYRLPITPHLIMLAGCGAASLWVRYRAALIRSAQRADGEPLQSTPDASVET